MTHKPEINVWFRVAGRDRDEGDKNTWQADCWHEGRDYHGMGSSPEEAVFRMSRFWVVERGFLREMASDEPQGPNDLSISGSTPSVAVCGICDIADCHHIRAQKDGTNGG